jgi:phenylacetate-CoA ligase
MSETSTDPRALARELVSRTRWSSERLATHQRERLAALLRHAVAASPYYREALGPDPAGVPLDQLPTLTRATLMARFDDIVTDRRFSRARVQAHLAGPHATEPLDGHLLVATSGSTGAPAVFVYSGPEMASAVAGLMRTIILFSVTPETRLVGIGAPSARHISRHLVAGLLAGRPSTAPRLSVTTPMPELVAEEQLAGRLRIAPRIVACTGETLTADMRERIRAAWGIEPHELYATTEAGVLASTSTRQAGLHLWEDHALVEVVDAAGAPVPPGVPGHKVLVTNLVNRVQPLIRYELSDTVTLAGGPDPAGWPMRRLVAVEGRSDDVIDLPMVDGGTVAVHPLHLRAPFVGFPDVVQYQVVHDERGLSVSTVLRPGAPADLTHRVRAALADRLVAAGAVPPPITVTAVAGIERDGGSGAKFATVRSRLRSRPSRS